MTSLSLFSRITCSARTACAVSRQGHVPAGKPALKRENDREEAHRVVRPGRRVHRYLGRAGRDLDESGPARPERDRPARGRRHGPLRPGDRGRRPLWGPDRVRVPGGGLDAAAVADRRPGSRVPRRYRGSVVRRANRCRHRRVRGVGGLRVRPHRWVILQRPLALEGVGVARRGRQLGGLVARAAGEARVPRCWPADRGQAVGHHHRAIATSAMERWRVRPRLPPEVWAELRSTPRRSAAGRVPAGPTPARLPGMMIFPANNNRGRFGRVAPRASRPDSRAV